MLAKCVQSTRGNIAHTTHHTDVQPFTTDLCITTADMVTHIKPLREKITLLYTTKFFINTLHTRRERSRIYKGGGGGGGGLTQGTNLLGGGVQSTPTSQHAKHAGTRGVWGHAPQEIFEK